MKPRQRLLLLKWLCNVLTITVVLFIVLLIVLVTRQMHESLFIYWIIPVCLVLFILFNYLPRVFTFINKRELKTKPPKVKPMIEATVFKFERPEEFKVFMDSFQSKTALVKLLPAKKKPSVHNPHPVQEPIKKRNKYKFKKRKQTLDELRTKFKPIRDMKGFLEAIEQHMFEMAKKKPISITRGYTTFRRLNKHSNPPTDVHDKIEAYLKKSIVLNPRNGKYWVRA